MNDDYDFQDIGNSCLNLTNNRVDHYCSWLPYGGQTIRDTEIGISGAVAEAIGMCVLYVCLCF